MLIEHLLKNIANEEKDRKWSNPLRMSSAGNCQRKIAYQLYEFVPKPLTSRARMVFRLGDTIEAEIKELIKKYPPKGYEIEYPQDPFVFVIDGKEITGHVDGIINKPRKMILEIKSINTRGFTRLKKEGISYGYQCQTTAYMNALKIPETLFIFYNKDTSHLLELSYKYDKTLFDSITQRYQNVIRSTKDKLPGKEYGPSDAGWLPFNCSYCPFIDECWPNAMFKINKYGSPTYLILKEKGHE